MEEIVFEVNRRKVIGKKVKNLRIEGELPAIVYGHNIESIPISLDYRVASKTLDEISPSSLVVLDIEGEKHYTLVRDKQRNPVRRTIIHVDFQAVSLTETLPWDLILRIGLLSATINSTTADTPSSTVRGEKNPAGKSIRPANGTIAGISRAVER